MISLDRGVGGGMAVRRSPEADGEADDPTSITGVKVQTRSPRKTPNRPKPTEVVDRRSEAREVRTRP